MNALIKKKQQQMMYFIIFFTLDSSVPKIACFPEFDSANIDLPPTKETREPPKYQLGCSP